VELVNFTLHFCSSLALSAILSRQTLSHLLQPQLDFIPKLQDFLVMPFEDQDQPPFLQGNQNFHLTAVASVRGRAHATNCSLIVTS